MRRIFLATINSWNGLLAAARSERAIREEIVILALAVPAAFLIATTAARAIGLILILMLLLTVELLNTAIEKLCDRVTLERDEQIGRVKDISSAAVGVALAMAGLLWLFAIAERFGLV